MGHTMYWIQLKLTELGTPWPVRCYIRWWVTLWPVEAKLLATHNWRA